MNFIHVSDLHFHKSQQDNVKPMALLKAIDDAYPKHRLIVTGDITDDGEERQYANAFKALKSFHGRVFIAPGNHDFGAYGNFYSQERARRFDRMLSEPLQQGGTFTGDSTPVVNIEKDGDDRVMLIALDTNLETDHFFDFACGTVGEFQLAVLDRILCDPSNSHYVKILFFHHHPLEHRHPGLMLLDWRDLMRVIFRRVDVLLFGHMHASAHWEDVNGIKHIVASDNSPESQKVREITVKGKEVTVDDVDMNQKGRKKRP